MTLVITGGAGTLGSDFLDYWLTKPDFEKLILIDNFVQSAIPKNQLTPSNVQLVELDCSNSAGLAEVFEREKPRGVLHFASTMELGSAGFRSNVETLLATIKAANVNLNPTIFFPQSFLTRDCNSTITDTSLAHPQSGDYPLFKTLCEKYLQTYPGKSVVGIISTTLSPRLSIGPIPAFSKRLVLDQPISISDSTRDYISPHAVIEGILMSLDMPGHMNTVVIASGISHSTLDIYRMISSQLEIIRSPEPAVLQPGLGDPKSINLKPSAQLQQSGWIPASGLNEALVNCIARVATSSSIVRQHHIK